MKKWIVLPCILLLACLHDGRGADQFARTSRHGLDGQAGDNSRDLQQQGG